MAAKWFTTVWLGIERILIHVANFSTWLLLWGFFIECSLTEVKEKRYLTKFNRDFSILDLDSVSDEVLEIAKATFADSEKRKTVVDDKCKVILTISSLSLPLISAFAPKIPDHFWSTFFTIVPFGF